jgi:hypothetical protein
MAIYNVKDPIAMEVRFNPMGQSANRRGIRMVKKADSLFPVQSFASFYLFRNFVYISGHTRFFSIMPKDLSR